MCIYKIRYLDFSSVEVRLLEDYLYVVPTCKVEFIVLNVSQLNFSELRAKLLHW